MRYFIILITSIWFLVGCEDLLDMEPKNSLTYGNSMTEKELEASVRGAQAIIRTYMMMHYNNGSNYVNGSYADEVEYTLSLRRNLDPQVIPGGDWGQHYNVISVANRTIYLAKHSDLDQDRKNLYLGQGYFLKAFIYYDLLKEWGECVLIKDEVEPKPVAKSPWTEIADYAIEVAQEAVDALPDFSEIKDSKGQYASYKSTPCKGAANALLAHLCAWKAGGKYFAREDQRNYDERELWLRAERACSWVIDSSVYQLALSPEEVCTEVMVGGSKESIFESVYKDQWIELGGMWQMLKFNPAREYENWPINNLATPSDNEWNTFNIKTTTVREMFPDGDLRKDAYFYKFEEMAHPDSVEITHGFAYPYKWRYGYYQDDGWMKFLSNINQNKIWWRLADIILLRAECRARLGGEYIAGAMEDLNTIRRRANAKLYSSSEYGGDLRYAIFKEREKELLMEGYRYYDVIRNGYVRTELEEGFRKASDQDFIDGCFFNAIESGAFNKNTLMRQNSYWLRYM